MTLQAPSWGSVPPQPGASGREPSVGTRVPPHAVSPLAGGAGSGAGGKARCAELAGWKQGHGAAGAERSHAWPRSRCPPLPLPPLPPRPPHGDCGARLGGSRWPHGGGCGTPVLPCPAAGPECSVGLCDRSILFLTARDVGGLGASPQHSTARPGTLGDGR